MRACMRYITQQMAAANVRIQAVQSESVDFTIVGIAVRILSLSKWVFFKNQNAID